MLIPFDVHMGRNQPLSEVRINPKYVIAICPSYVNDKHTIIHVAAVEKDSSLKWTVVGEIKIVAEIINTAYERMKT